MHNKKKEKETGKPFEMKEIKSDMKLKISDEEVNEEKSNCCLK